jgi:hypothetical protein
MKDLSPKHKPLSKLGLLGGLLLSASVGMAAPSVSVKVTAPTGSASKEFNSKIVKSMLYTPCVDASGGAIDFGNVGTLTGTSVDNSFDQFLIKVTGTNSDEAKDGAYDFDLYVFIVNIGASGTAADIANAQFYQFSRIDAFGTTTGVTLDIFALAANLDSNKMLLRAADFSSATIDETIMGGTIWFDQFSLPQGTWMATAIVADNATVDFEDPKTWAAWDAVPFILGTPWRTTSGTDTGGTCN